MINSGHVLPESPPLHHELDRTWNGLLAKLEFLASMAAGVEIERVVPVPVCGLTYAEMEWVAGCPRGVRRHGYTDPVSFWNAAAERVNRWFDRQKTERAIRRQFFKSVGGAGIVEAEGEASGME